MKNFIQPGKTLTFTMTADVNSGDGVKVGTLIVVAQADALDTEQVECLTEGVVELKRDSSDIFTEGLKVFWDDSLKQITIVSTANTQAGTAVEAQSAGAGNIKVKLLGHAA